MYADFYGLTGRPFELTTDPRFLLLTPKHREALSLTEYVLSGAGGLAVLIGEAGTGKTTLLRAALHDPRRNGDTVVTLDNPTLTRDEFFEFLADGFELGRKAAGSKTRVLRELTRVLAERRRSGATAALVVDEAQSLSDELLEEIRLLANMETPRAKLLSILLAGQPELAQRLNEPARRQLKQRIALRAVLAPLTLPETADYVAGRLRMVGGDAAGTFTAAAVREVFAHSGGIPRTVSVICDNALIAGFALSARPIDRDVVLEVCRELDLAPETASPVPVAPTADAAAPPEPAESRSTAVAESEPRVEPPWRGVLDRLRFWKRRTPAPLRMETRYFDVDGRSGVLVIPSADEGRAVKS